MFEPNKIKKWSGLSYETNEEKWQKNKIECNLSQTLRFYQQQLI